MKKEITVLKEARKRQKLTQTDIANRLNISRECISYWENNLQSPVSKDMWRVAQAYELTNEEIIQWIRMIAE